jgi:hypothetical protein
MDSQEMNDLVTSCFEYQLSKTPNKKGSGFVWIVDAFFMGERVSVYASSKTKKGLVPQVESFVKECSDDFFEQYTWRNPQFARDLIDEMQEYARKVSK